MKIKIFLTIFFISFSLNLGSTEQIDESKIHKNLRCLVCQGQSIADSNSDFAITLKMVVKDLIKNGKSEDEIYDFLSEKYGDWILYNPKLNAGNLLLWSLPYLVLVFGGVIIVFLIRKRSKKT
mgnify:FL=1